ncbi:hypothetical protein [Saccharothrix sp. ST-888]|uniref:hypothetical protein n=1 Tax=Saccharothrix sp. ST-888 TaxID=1427391 RepID=UPI0005ECDF22|nr:hypothetical protein [Saccharothrix sp. ST-888]KJK58899.1 hypothetical protein UK12_07285 [Saccharothrix sp. ST-888]
MGIQAGRGHSTVAASVRLLLPVPAILPAAGWAAVLRQGILGSGPEGPVPLSGTVCRNDRRGIPADAESAE